MKKLFIILTKIMIGELKLDMGGPKTPEQPKKPEQKKVLEQKEKFISDSPENKIEQKRGKQKEKKGDKKKDFIDKMFDKVIDFADGDSEKWKSDNSKRWL